MQHARRAIFTRKTCSKISVGLSIWPKMTIISLSMNSLNSRRLQVMFISSSVRICEQRNRKVSKWGKTKTPKVPHWKHLYLFAGDVLQVFLHHDLPQTGFDLSLRQLPFRRPAEVPRKQTSHHSSQLSSCCRRELNRDTYTSENSTGESARCDCTSCMAFHSLMRTWSEETLL